MFLKILHLCYNTEYITTLTKPCYHINRTEVRDQKYPLLN